MVEILKLFGAAIPAGILLGLFAVAFVGPQTLGGVLVVIGTCVCVMICMFHLRQVLRCSLNLVGGLGKKPKTEDPVSGSDSSAVAVTGLPQPEISVTNRGREEEPRIPHVSLARKLDQPEGSPGHPDYGLQCEVVIEPLVRDIVAQAENAGWQSEVVWNAIAVAVAKLRPVEHKKSRFDTATRDAKGNKLSAKS